MVNMALEVKLIHKITYKLRLTPQVRLSINLLQMPLIKLKDFIERRIEENPLLNIENIGLSSKPKKDFEEDANDEEAKQRYKESLITKPLTLQDHLIKQLHLLAESDEERKIGELIIGNIDD